MAIARVASSVLGLQFSSSYSASYTVGAGSNRLLIVPVFAGTSDDMTSPAYNGVAMSVIGPVQCPTDRFLYLCWLLNPASGANNFTCTCGGGVGMAIASDYTGVKQSAQPDASGTTSISATSISKAITVVNANSWVVATVKTTHGSLQAWTNATEVGNGSGMDYADTNAAVGTGSITITASDVNNTDLAMIVASFQPDTGGGGGRGLFRTPPSTGVGVGGSFFRDPLQAREQMVKRNHIFVPERYAA